MFPLSSKWQLATRGSTKSPAWQSFFSGLQLSLMGRIYWFFRATHWIRLGFLTQIEDEATKGNKTIIKPRSMGIAIAGCNPKTSEELWHHKKVSKRALQRSTTNDVINLSKYSETTSRTTYTRKILPNTISFIVKKSFKNVKKNLSFCRVYRKLETFCLLGRSAVLFATKAGCVHALNLACKLRRLLLNSSNHKNNFKTWLKFSC